MKVHKGIAMIEYIAGGNKSVINVHVYYGDTEDNILFRAKNKILFETTLLPTAIKII